MLPSIWRRRGQLAGPTLDDFIEKFFYGWPGFEKESDVNWAPRVDIHETDKELILDVELPGMEKKDIKIGVKNDILTISGERKQERKTEGSEYYRHERHYGKFERSFTIPETVDADNISANYKNGVLTLNLPKAKEVLPREIAIDVK